MFIRFFFFCSVLCPEGLAKEAAMDAMRATGMFLLIYGHFQRRTLFPFVCRVPCPEGLAEEAVPQMAVQTESTVANVRKTLADLRELVEI